MLGGMAVALAVLLYQPVGSTGGGQFIVDFAEGTDADAQAHGLCLRHGCRVLRVYRYFPGAAVSGGDTESIARAGEVTGMSPDPAVHLAGAGEALAGAPDHRPVAVIGGGLDGDAVLVGRNWHAAGPTPTALRLQTTRLVAALAPRRGYWSYAVFDAQGNGRLSDLLAALDTVIAHRHAIAAVFMPVVVAGRPSPRLCQTVNDVLRRGLLVITGAAEDCPSQP